MSNKWVRLLVLAISLLAPVASAEEAFVLVCLEDAPLRHIKVAVDGEVVGVTEENYRVPAPSSVRVFADLGVSDLNGIYNRSQVAAAGGCWI